MTVMTNKEHVGLVGDTIRVSHLLREMKNLKGVMICLEI